MYYICNLFDTFIKIKLGFQLPEKSYAEYVENSFNLTIIQSMAISMISIYKALFTMWATHLTTFYAYAGLMVVNIEYGVVGLALAYATINLIRYLMTRRRMRAAITQKQTQDSLQK
jgi:hypothetical protein